MDVGINRRQRALIALICLAIVLEDDDDDLDNVFLLLTLLRQKTDRHRQKNYVQDIVSGMRTDEFKIFFRVSRGTCETLREWVVRVCVDQDITGVLCRTGSGGSIQKPLEDRLLMLLWFMASLDKYSSIADRFGMSESTACDAISELLHIIREYLVDSLIVWPSQNEMQHISDMYMELKNFEGVVGMIDATHVPISKPKHRGVDYYNRKDYYSVILQAVVREDLRFTDVFCGYPGKVHDSRVFRNSPLYEKGARLCTDRHILGDSGYPNLPWLLVPYRDNGNLTQAQRCYNMVHSSIRSTVERAFALLKGRFKRLTHLDQRKDTNKVVSTVLCGCVLHNMCILNNDELQDHLYDEPVAEVEPQVHNVQFDDMQQERAAAKRIRITQNLL